MAFIEYSGDVLTVIDEVGTISYQSPSVERNFGYAPNEFVAEDGFEYEHPDDRIESADIVLIGHRLGGVLDAYGMGR